MTLLLKCLPHTHKDLSSDPHCPWRKWGAVACVCKHKAKEMVAMRFIDPWTFLPSPLIHLNWQVSGSVKDPVSKIRWRAIKEDSWCWNMASISTYENVHVHLYKHTHTHTYIYYTHEEGVDIWYLTSTRKYLDTIVYKFCSEICKVPKDV